MLLSIRGPRPRRSGLSMIASSWRPACNGKKEAGLGLHTDVDRGRGMPLKRHGRPFPVQVQIIENLWMLVAGCSEGMGLIHTDYSTEPFPRAPSATPHQTKSHSSPPSDGLPEYEAA